MEELGKLADFRDPQVDDAFAPAGENQREPNEKMIGGAVPDCVQQTVKHLDDVNHPGNGSGKGKRIVSSAKNKLLDTDQAPTVSMNNQHDVKG
ncbi:hypothetical protein [Pedobacter sp. GR22-6]|uniref:hypothetical protein n=1 Tax=Pedobacter sp. GR22-6 TaxID=3127957 RepID=UPI00307D93FF